MRDLGTSCASICSAFMSSSGRACRRRGEGSSSRSRSGSRLPPVRAARRAPPCRVLPTSPTRGSGRGCSRGVRPVCGRAQHPPTSPSTSAAGAPPHLPLGWLPLIHAQSIFAGLAWPPWLMRGGSEAAPHRMRERGRTVVRVSGQWSPILTASALLPMLVFVWAAKPSLGLALAVGYASRPAIIGALVLTAIQFSGLAEVAHRVAAGLHGVHPNIAPIAGRAASCSSPRCFGGAGPRGGCSP